MSGYGTDKASSLSLESAAETVVEVMSGINDNLPEGTPPVNVIHRWTGRATPNSILVHFMFARKIDFGYEVGFRLEYVLSADPAAANARLYAMFGYVMEAADACLTGVTATVEERSATGQSKATGASFSILSIEGVHTVMEN